MYNISQKVIDIHNSIRKQRNESYFQQQRDLLLRQTITPQIRQKYIAQFQELLYKNDIKKIYQIFVHGASDVVELIKNNCQRIFELACNFLDTKKEAIHLLALLIIHSYDQICQKLDQKDLFTKIQDELQKSLCSNNETQTKLYLCCFKNLISKKNSKFSAQKFIKRFYQPWFQYLYKTPNFIVIIYYVSQNHYINPQIILPVILKGIKDLSFSTSLSVSYSMILSNLVKLCPIEQLAPYLRQILQCLKYTYFKKDIFTTAIRMRALTSIGQVFDKIPSNKMDEIRIIQIYNSTLKNFFYSILQVESIKIKTLVYNFLGILLEKSLQQNQILRTLCTKDLIEYLVQGLQYHNIQILHTTLKILYNLCNSTDSKLGLVNMIFKTEIKINLQNLAYHPNQFICQYSTQLLNISNYIENSRMPLQ